MTNTTRARGDVPPREDAIAGTASITPIWISRRFQIALIVGAIALLALAVWRVPGILAIVIGAAAIALLLSYPVRWLSRVMPRWMAVLVTLLLVLGVIVVALAALIPLVIGQLSELIAAWPSIQSDLDRMLEEAARALQSRGLLPAESTGPADDLVQGLSSRVEEVAGDLLGGLLSLASGAFGFAVQLIAVVSIAIYLLLDVDKLRAWFIALPPAEYRDDAEELWDTFGHSMSRYLGGVVLVAVITGVMAGVALWLLGVPYAGLLGAWVGFTTIIPIVGTYLGIVPALPLALAQSPTTALLTILVYVLIQLVQDNLLTPRVQGETAHVHPALVLVIVLWTGLAFGLLWSVLAVPAVVVVHVLYDFFRVRLRPAARATRPSKRPAMTRPGRRCGGSDSARAAATCGLRARGLALWLPRGGGIT